MKGERYVPVPAFTVPYVYAALFKRNTQFFSQPALYDGLVSAVPFRQCARDGAVALGLANCDARPEAACRNYQ